MSDNEKIIVDVASLLAQSASMKTLKEEYNALFDNVTSILNGMNDGWSENLANNFVGKISTAQKGFAKIVDMLEVGENVAKEAANSFEEVNSVMARQYSGVLGNLFSTISGGMGNLSDTLGTGTIFQQIAENFSWDNYKGALDYITDGKVYQTLSNLEQSLFGTNYLSQADGIIADGVGIGDTIQNILNGNIINPENIGNIANLVDFEKLGLDTGVMGYLVEGAKRFLDSENPQSYAIDYGYAMDSVIQSFKDGDVLEGAAGYILYTAEAAGRTFVDIVGDSISGTAGMISNGLETIGVPVTEIKDGFENIVENITGYDYDILTDAIGQGISDGVDQFVDTAVQGWGYIQDTIEIGADIVGDALVDGWNTIASWFK